MAKTFKYEETYTEPEQVGIRQRVKMTVAAWKDKLARKGLNEDGTIIPDDKSLDPPLGWQKPVHMHDIIRNMILSEEYKRKAHEEGFETLEESDDFDEDYEAPPESRYEIDDDLEAAHALSARRNKAFQEEALKKEAKPTPTTNNAPPASAEGGAPEQPAPPGPNSTIT